jgi:16S rRNA (guanine966-N2)-methyltransferase
MARRGLRVVAGSAGGLRLTAAPTTRPTTDRVREALFSALGADVVEDASVLDLYAGSGALGIEAVSRGAASAVLVDHDPGAVDACRSNIVTTKLENRVRVVQIDVRAFLRSGPPAEAPFDLVCCDPPYDIDAAELGGVLVGLAAPGWLASEGRVVVEGPARGAGPRPEGWTVAWERKYGDTLVSVLRIPPRPDEHR